MSKRNNSNRGMGIGRKERRLRCPVCKEPTGFKADRECLGDGIELSLSSRPGDLTQCDHCLTMLEYRGNPTSLTLHLAPRQRVEAFNKLASEEDPSLRELVDYVMRFRQMPRRPPIGHRFRAHSKGLVK